MNFSTKLNRKLSFMGAIKSNNYSQEELQLALLGRAISHPARKKIIDRLVTFKTYRNIDFSKELNLSPTAVKNHLDTLKAAHLIRTIYMVHYYEVILEPEGFKLLNEFLRKIDWNDE